MKATFSLPGLLRFMVKATLILIVCGLLIGIIALKVVERSPDQLKMGFESYLTQLSGYPAEIDKLNKVQFFPTLSLDMSDIRFWPLDDPNGKAITVEHVTTDMPLWSVMIGQPRFSILSLKNMVFAKDVTGIAPLFIKQIAVNETRDGLSVTGMVDTMALEATIPLQQIGNGAMYRMPQAPVRVTGKIDGGRTRGNYFIDFNKDGYGATASFETYRAADMNAIQLLLQRWAAGRPDGVLPIQLHIERLRDKSGGQSGPYVVPAVRLENGNLQPLQCFYNNQGRAQVDTHPCAAYFKEPDANLTP